MSKYGTPAPRVSVNTNWTSALCAQAYADAEAGNYRLLGDLIEAVASHPEVRSAMNILIGTLLSMPLDADGEPDQVRAYRGHFEMSGTLEPKRNEHGAIAEGERFIPGDFALMFPFEELYLFLVTSILAGFAEAETEQTIVHPKDGRWIDVLRAWNIRHFYDDRNTGKRYVRAARTEGSTSFVNVEIHPNEDGKWWEFTPFGKERPWMKGLAKGLIDTWLLAGVYAPQDWGQVSARSGGGLLLAKLKETEDTALQTRADKLAEAGAKGGVAAVREGEDIEALEFGSSSWQGFEAQIANFSRMVCVAILGGDLIQNAGGGGSYAALDGQRQVLETGLVDRYAKALCAFMAAGPGRLWWERNFAPKGAPPVGRYERKTTQQELEQQAQEAAAKRAEAQVKQIEVAERALAIGITFDLQAFGASLGLPPSKAAAPVEAGAFIAPRPVAAEAASGLALFNRYSKPGVATSARRGSPAAAKMARMLKSGTPLNRGDLIDIVTFTDDAERVGASEQGWSNDADPSAQWIDFRCYGGEAGRSWANAELDKLDGVPGGNAEQVGEGVAV